MTWELDHRVPTAVPALPVVTEITRLVRTIQDGSNGLTRLPKELLTQFSQCVDGVDCQQGVDVAAAMGDELWLRIVDLHHATVRDLVELSTTGSSRARRVEILLGSILVLFIKTNALKTGSVLGSRLAVALIETDTFHCYSRLLAAWTSLPASDMEPKLRLMAQFSLIFSSCAQLTVSDQPLTPDDHTGTALYQACLEALSSSQLLEHMSRALLRALRAAAQEQLPADQARNIRVGVEAIVNCIVSTIHGIAGKQGMPVSCLTSYEGKAPPDEDLARRLLSQVRAVVSGPDLQSLLQREIVGSILKLTGGKGPRHGLEDALLPELIGLDPAAPDTRVLTDRLMCRLGMVSLVWHLMLPERRDQGWAGQGAPCWEGPVISQPAEQAAPQLVSPGGLAGMFDMVLKALSCVVEASTPEEHLPGGSQLTLVEPAMLLVRLIPRLHPEDLRERLGKLWQALAQLMMRPQVRLQYSENRPLQLIGGLLRPEEQQGVDAMAAGAVSVAPVGDAVGCSYNLRCALDAGLLRAIEHLLRDWARADPSSKGETSCLCAVNHLLRWPCVWTPVLAHGSVLEVASLTITLRRLGEVFKDRGFEAMSLADNNEPNVHQDAEVVITAYMVALLEQQAVVLLRPTGDKPLALNDALESDGLAVFAEAVDQLDARPAAGTPAAQQQRALAVFAVSQWLPNAVWLTLDKRFSVDMGKAALRWALEAGLQCLAARTRSEAEWAEAAARPATEAGRPGAVAAAQRELQPEAQAAPYGGSSTGSTGPSSSGELAAVRPCGPGAVAYEAWVTFLMVGVDMLAWIHKYLAQLKEAEGRAAEGGEVKAAEAEGSEAEGDVAEGGEALFDASAARNPEALLPSVLNILEILTLAMPRSVQMYVTKGDKPNAPTAGAASTHGEAVPFTTTTTTVAKAKAAQTATAQPFQPSTAVFLEGTKLDRGIVLDGWLGARLEREGRLKLLSVLQVWAEDNSAGGDGQGSAGASQAAGTASEEQTPQLLALRAEVAAKHDLAHLPELPSPYAAAEVVEAVGIKPCANPACSNLEGSSEAELSGRKTCARCSCKCQPDHRRSPQKAECPGTAQRQQAAAPAVPRAASQQAAWGRDRQVFRGPIRRTGAVQRGDSYWQDRPVPMGDGVLLAAMVSGHNSLLKAPNPSRQ